MNDLNSKVKKSSRRLAFEALFDVFFKDAYTNIIIRQIIRHNELSLVDKRLFTELVYGVCRKYNYLNYVINQLSTRPIQKIHPIVRVLLYIGLYQLIFLDKIPESAAVNETVKIAKKVTHQGNKNFINALLRNFLRQRQTIILPDKNNNFEEYLSVQYNIPLWLAKRWLKNWGKHRTESVLCAFDKTPLLYVRGNTVKITNEALAKEFDRVGIEYQVLKNFPSVFLITQSNDFLFSYFLKNGLIYIQSLSSMIPAYVIEAEPKDCILDMCAAPGSKTMQMAAMMENKGVIDAWDLYPHKIDLIKENARVLGINIVNAMVKDSTVPYSSAVNKYDKVLLDAPCSGLGVLAHKPEIRWKRNEDDLQAFSSLQGKLIEQAAKYVKNGGILVYSTCTLESVENEILVQNFLQKHRDFISQDFVIKGIGESNQGMMTLWPDQHDSDGFFVAKLRKISDED